MSRKHNVVDLLDSTNSTNLTSKHQSYIMALNSHEFYPTIAYGSAGTGKTFTALQEAMNQLEKGVVRKVVCIRPNVSFADSSGYLPGTEREKLEPWCRPVRQSLNKLGYSDSQIETLERAGKLVFYPLEFVQGMTFDNSFILVDEVQNVSFHQLKILLTRIGNYSRIVLAGDVAQISHKFHKSGLAELIYMSQKTNMYINLINFTQDDIIRSGQCKDWICGFEMYEADKEMEEDDRMY